MPTTTNLKSIFFTVSFAEAEDNYRIKLAQHDHLDNLENVTVLTNPCPSFTSLLPLAIFLLVAITSFICGECIHCLLETAVTELALFIHHKVQSIPSCWINVMLQWGRPIICIHNMTRLIVHLQKIVLIHQHYLHESQL